MDTKVFLKRGQGNKVRVEEHVEGFHDLVGEISKLAMSDSEHYLSYMNCPLNKVMRATYNRKTHDECPETGHRMGFSGLPGAQLMLVGLTIEGIVHEIRVGQNLIMADVDRVVLLFLDVRHVGVLFSFSPGGC